MNGLLSLNGKFTFASGADISALSTAALYGKGIFTSVAIHDGEPFLWEKHWLRLSVNAAQIGIDLSEHSKESSRQALHEILKENEVASGRARITFFDEQSSGIWAFENTRKTSLLILTGEFRPVAESFRVGISPYPINSCSPLAGVKSCSYLENFLSVEHAKAGGFDEAIRVNENGHVTSACMANVFWLKGDVLYTPSLKTGCLAGTTREFVMENLACREVGARIGELERADAIFLTSAGLGITEVTMFCDKVMDKPAGTQAASLRVLLNSK